MNEPTCPHPVWFQVYREPHEDGGLTTISQCIRCGQPRTRLTDQPPKRANMNNENVAASANQDLNNANMAIEELKKELIRAQKDIAWYKEALVQMVKAEHAQDAEITRLEKIINGILK